MANRRLKKEGRETGILPLLNLIHSGGKIMKRIMAVLAVPGLILYSSAYAQTMISLGSAVAEAGDTASLSVVLNNSAAVGGFQFVVKAAPSGRVTFVRAEASGRAEGWTVSSNAAGDSVSLLVLSQAGANIDAGNEAVMQLKYLVASAAPEGAVTMSLSGIKGADSNLNPVSGVTSANGLITVQTSAAAGDTLRLSNGEAFIGSTVELDLVLSNTTAVAGFQFTLSSGSIAVTISSITVSGRAVGWTVSYNSTSTGTEVIAYSSTGGTIAAGSGVVLKVRLAVSVQASPQDIAVMIKNLKISDALQNPIAGFSSVDGTVTVKESESGTSAFNRGDVNRNGKTDIFDLLELLGILGGNLEDYK